jgi:hypothetical protein
MDEETQQAPLLTAAALGDEPGPARGAWLREGARVLVFRAPRWAGLEARPLTVAVLVLAGYLISFVVQRALMDGAPQPHWAGFLAGWSSVAVIAWLCWVVARSGGVRASPSAHPATLFALCCSASVVFSLALGAGLIALRAVKGPADDWPSGLQWTAFLLPVTWAGLAQIALLWRVAGTPLARAAAFLLTPIPLVLNAWLAPPAFWWPEPAPQVEAVGSEGHEADAGLPLTDEIVSAQPELLARALGALRPPQPGRVNVYAATYAPYGSQDVFMRESAVVARTMRERFGADGRLVELVVNPATATTLPWATPLNLRKAITRMAGVMNREHDVLFLHLTSHGGADGQLANDTWPLQTEPMTPQLLKRWLDEAGVRWRVISISACYSGSWIAPLAGDGTLVMTAADAEHTSYGCGKRSELTFFGRAMYEDALRQTWSFTDAHAQARELIRVREQEAGKSDGYSNPQISEGTGIRAVLKRLEAERRDR